MHEKNGFYSFGGSEQSFKTITAVLSGSRYYFGPCTHQGYTQCSCGPGVLGRPNSHGMVLGSRLFFMDFPEVQFVTPGRPFCYQGEFEIRFVCLSLPGPDSICPGRNSPELEPALQLRLCLSSAAGHSLCRRPDCFLPSPVRLSFECYTILHRLENRHGDSL